MKQVVVVIDDSAMARQLVKRAFRDSEFEIVEAVDGLDGLECINEIGQPAAVICDVNMPRMTGLEMVTLLMQNPKFAGVPVLMLTSESRPDFIQQARAAGARGWVTKPFRGESLLLAIRSLTSPKSATMLAHRGGAPSSARSASVDRTGTDSRR